MQTTAIVIPAANTIELRTVQLKALGADDVLVQTRLTSISAGTERMLLKGVMPHPMLQFPVVPGYETIGEVIDAGENAQAWLGRSVYVGGNYGFIGVNPAFGGQSARIVAPVAQITDIESLTDRQGVLLALAATALHGVDVAGLQPGQQVLILGQGVVGQLAARFAHAGGAHVTVIERTPSRLAIAVADEKYDALPQAPPMTPPQFDVLIDATGKMDAIAPVLMRIKKGGRIVLLGYYDALNLPYQPLFLRELALLTSAQWAPGDLVRARDAIAEKCIDVSTLITHSMSAQDAQEAFAVSFDDPQCIKMVLTWKEDSIHPR
jgi:bacteriochlorophyllide a dehydrogenase